MDFSKFCLILNNEKTSQNYLNSVFFAKILKLNDYQKNIFDSIVKRGQIFFIFDSLDRVPSSILEKVVERGQIFFIFDTLDRVSSSILEKVHGLLYMIFSVSKMQQIVIFIQSYIASQLDNEIFGFVTIVIEEMNKFTIYN